MGIKLRRCLVLELGRVRALERRLGEHSAAFGTGLGVEHSMAQLERMSMYQ